MIRPYPMSRLRFQAQCERGMPTEAWEATHPAGAAAWLHWLRESGWREWPGGLGRFPQEVAPCD